MCGSGLSGGACVVEVGVAGVCAGGMCGRGHAWWGMQGWQHARLGACVGVGNIHGRGMYGGRHAW